MRTFKVEIRKECKICNAPITIPRGRTYCSEKCRVKFHNTKQRPDQKIWQQKRRDALASVPSDKKVQCLICKKWYVQVGTHVVQIHGVSAREYRENFDLERKRGVVPKWYREMKGEQAINNGTVVNLKQGAKFRFVKGDTRAGRYTRSQITMERLKKLSSYNKNAKK